MKERTGAQRANERTHEQTDRRICKKRDRAGHLAIIVRSLIFPFKKKQSKVDFFFSNFFFILHFYSELRPKKFIDIVFKWFTSAKIPQINFIFQKFPNYRKYLLFIIHVFLICIQIILV